MNILQILNESLYEKRVKNKKIINEGRRFQMMGPDTNWPQRNNFSTTSDGSFITFLVLGDTFKNKEQIKSDGGKWVSGLGWILRGEKHYEDCVTIPVNIEDVAELDFVTDTYYDRFKDESELKEFVKTLYYEYKDEFEKIKSSKIEGSANYIGPVGTRVVLTGILLCNPIPVTYSSASIYWSGTTEYYKYLMKTDSGQVVYIRSTHHPKYCGRGQIYHDCKVNDKFTVGATVQSYSVLKGTGDLNTSWKKYIGEMLPHVGRITFNP